ncbi:MAG: peptide deformylase [Candidatus Margulisiibacteriota bacterium]
MILKIFPYPNPILRKKSFAVKKVDAKIKKLIKDMIETMHAAPGVGLAAPQVGENIRVIVVDIGEGAFGIVNPKIKKKNKETQIFDEGCLSLLGIAGPVKRPSKVTVEGLDKNGEKMTIEAEGFLATVIQHEIDHLDGKMFVDHIEDKSLIHEVPRKEEEEKKELI